MAGRNHTSQNQQKAYSITVGSSLAMKAETEIQAGAIFTKASLTLGIEKSSEKSEQV